MKKLWLILVACVVVAVVLVVLMRPSSREESLPAVPPPVERTTEREVVVDLPIVEEPQSVLEPPTSEEVVARRRSFLDELEPLDISQAVRTVIGEGGALGTRRERQEALQKLTRKLSPDDVTALRAFLHTRFADQEELRLLSFNAIKNDALDILLRQDDLPEELGNQLVEMYRNGQHDDVWRDYCVQYFAVYYEQRWQIPGRGRGPVPPPREGESRAVDSSPDVMENPERKEIQAAYWEAISEKKKTIAGTALMAIERLSRIRSEFDREKIGAAAAALAADDECLEGSRITALRVCGHMGTTEALPAARILSQTGETTMLRMAAIATLGDLGDEQDIYLVETMASSDEKRIATVAASALLRLKKRLEG